MKWKILSASVRGAAHQRTGLPNQDAVDYAVASRENPATVLAVSDGHGGSHYFRSQVGSTLAVHIAVRLMGEFLANAQRDRDVQGLCERIVAAWRASVLSDLANNPFTEEELAKLEEAEGVGARESILARPEYVYGATLLAVGTAQGCMLYLQLGDGDILAVDAEGDTHRPIVADERLVANQTTSLCQPDAWQEFRTALTDDAAALPLLVLISSDGYVNSFRSEEDFLQTGTDYFAILREQGSDALAHELPNILSDATKQGSSDDISLGLLHRDMMQRAGPTTPVAVPAAGGTEGPKPQVSKSVLIKSLKTAQHTQQRKLCELSTNYEGAQQHIRQLKILLVVAGVAVAMALTQSFWRPLFAKHLRPVVPAPSAGEPATGVPKRPSNKRPERGPAQEPVAAPVVEPGAKPSAGSFPTGKVRLMLTLDEGRVVPMDVGRTISAGQIVPGEGEEPYAKVKKQDSILKLTNLSHDVWTVTTPGVKAKAKFNQRGRESEAGHDQRYAWLHGSGGGAERGGAECKYRPFFTCDSFGPHLHDWTSAEGEARVRIAVRSSGL